MSPVSNKPGHSGISQSASIFALKTILKNTLTKTHKICLLKDEIIVQRELAQKTNSIVKILKVYETDKDIKILMDLCQGGNLTQLIKKRKAIKEQEARIISAQLLLTVDLLSLKQITHRDLKPQNVLIYASTENPNAMVSADDIKVADFGFACDIAKLKKPSSLENRNGAMGPGSQNNRNLP